MDSEFPWLTIVFLMWKYLMGHSPGWVNIFWYYHFLKLVSEDSFTLWGYVWEKLTVYKTRPSERKKPATHYSSLFANNDKTTFSLKKLSFEKRDEKRSTHCSSQTQVFANVCRNGKYGKKSSLNLSKTAYSSECIIQNAHESDEPLSTHYSHSAWISFVRSFFILVCE